MNKDLSKRISFYLPMYEKRPSICRYCREEYDKHFDNMQCRILDCNLFEGPPKNQEYSDKYEFEK